MKKKVYRTECVLSIFDEYKYDEFVKLINEKRSYILDLYKDVNPEEINIVLEETPDYYGNYHHEVCLGFFREETDAEYSERIAKEKQIKKQALDNVFLSVDKHKEDVIAYLKSKGEI